MIVRLVWESDPARYVNVYNYYISIFTFYRSFDSESMTNITDVCHIFHKMQAWILHLIFLCNEAEYISERGAEQLIFGISQYDTASLSNEVTEFFKGKGIKVKLLVPSKVIQAWNKA